MCTRSYGDFEVQDVGTMGIVKGRADDRSGQIMTEKVPKGRLSICGHGQRRVKEVIGHESAIRIHKMAMEKHVSVYARCEFRGCMTDDG